MTDREIVLPIKGQRESSIRLYYSNSPQYDRPLIEHFHPEIEIQIMESGCGTYYYNGKTHTIQPHDVYFFRSNERHYVTNRTADANGRPSTSYGFYFMPEFIQHLDADVLGTKYMSVFSNQNYPSSTMFQQTVMQQNRSTISQEISWVSSSSKSRDMKQ
ncbi:MAG: AraC family ligand binding domain-containing protein [Firmicutes bacterium]|nr:AraC family ligand binding domain-containing protein [Bacillota bacterium]